MTAANTIWNSMSNQGKCYSRVPSFIQVTLAGGQLGSASSLTNLSSEVHPSVTRTRSASELIETTSVSGHLRSKQKVKVRHSVADSSDYYNNRRPQSISLSAQIPVFSTLQSASSVSALGTISENEAIHGSSPNTQTDNDSAIFAEPPDTPLFHYKSSLTELAIPLRGPFHQQHTKLSQTSSNQLSQMAGAGSCHLNAVSSNSYLDSPTTTASPIHTSEPITQQFVPLYLNPHTGQMYSQNHNYFRPISSPTEFISGPPKPVCQHKDCIFNSLWYHKMNL